VFAPTGVTWPALRGILEKLRSLQAETVLLTDAGNREAQTFGRAIRLPGKLPELFTPIPYIVPAQLFAACLAGQRGLDPDRPRTLSKVTRTL
jgi:glucosamine--fructose-6-phosphate aminotransferase (isomerizing)